MCQTPKVCWKLGTHGSHLMGGGEGGEGGGEGGSGNYEHTPTCCPSRVRLVSCSCRRSCSSKEEDEEGREEGREEGFQNPVRA